MHGQVEEAEIQEGGGSVLNADVEAVASRRAQGLCMDIDSAATS